MNSKKVTKFSKSSISYYWKNYECELCKKMFTLTLDQSNPLIDYSTPEKNFMVLESLSDSSSKQYFVVNLDSNDSVFTLGRGND